MYLREFTRKEYSLPIKERYMFYKEAKKVFPKKMRILIDEMESIVQGSHKNMTSGWNSVVNCDQRLLETATLLHSRPINERNREKKLKTSLDFTLLTAAPHLNCLHFPKETKYAMSRQNEFRNAVFTKQTTKFFWFVQFQKFSFLLFTI